VARRSFWVPSNIAAQRAQPSQWTAGALSYLAAPVVASPKCTAWSAARLMRIACQPLMSPRAARDTRPIEWAASVGGLVGT